ncbi:MAG: hypothetical protein WC876_03575 [Candidatus Thermoplasmatota archaeon]
MAAYTCPALLASKAKAAGKGTDKARPIQVASGFLLLAAGAYMVWFYGRAGLF